MSTTGGDAIVVTPDDLREEFALMLERDEGRLPVSVQVSVAPAVVVMPVQVAAQRERPASLAPASSDAAEKLAGCIEDLAARIGQDRAALASARGAEASLSVENRRLEAENKRMRHILTTLIRALDGERRHHADRLSEVVRRLRDL